jgi:pyruvate dehydrogenase E2 component (dihydrolipoamide acetyltransferase)
MATPVILPRQGQSVETCLLIEWRVQPGETVAEGDILCEVETDKASFEIEAPCAGTLLAHFFPEDADVPVLTNIAAIGEAGENCDDLRPEGEGGDEPAAVESAPEPEAAPVAAAPVVATKAAGDSPVSPRAKSLADGTGFDPSTLAGTGPGGRVIERDVKAFLDSNPAMTPAAVAAGGATPAVGTGIGGRITAADRAAGSAGGPPATVVAEIADEVTEIPVKGIRKLISDRMLESLQTTAQLTLNSWAPAEQMLGLRKRFKGADESLGLAGVTVNDLLLFAIARTLGDFPELNAIFANDTVYQHKGVHLAFAVDTPRGLMVPVIRHAEQLSLKQISAEAKRLALACIEGGISPDDLQGGTFTVSNLGNFGIEVFTPVLNPPQVGILGIGCAALKPVKTADGIGYEQQLCLSLTINHQVVDGAPAARFLQAMRNALGNIDLLLAG